MRIKDFESSEELQAYVEANRRFLEWQAKSGSAKKVVMCPRCGAFVEKASAAGLSTNVQKSEAGQDGKA